MKKKIEYILMLILFALSLIYTNSATNIIKKEDTNNEKYYEK